LFNEGKRLDKVKNQFEKRESRLIEAIYNEVKN